jgi:hypothetical protein
VVDRPIRGGAGGSRQLLPALSRRVALRALIRGWRAVSPDRP